MKHKRPATLRLVEILLIILGISLLGGAAAETFGRLHYQAQQERAFETRRPAISVEAPAPAPPVVLPAPAPLPEPPTTDYRPPTTAKPKAAAKPRAEGAARIEIPRLGIRAIVKEGADDRTLSRAVGLVPGTARPGEIGNTVLAGHRDTFFRPLRRIRENDRIRVIVPPHTYEYRVDSTRVVDPEETSVLASDGDEELTLVTCYPFYFVGPAPQRFIVSAKRVH
jgi:sortase A